MACRAGGWKFSHTVCSTATDSHFVSAIMSSVVLLGPDCKLGCFCLIYLHAAQETSSEADGEVEKRTVFFSSSSDFHICGQI